MPLWIREHRMVVAHHQGHGLAVEVFECQPVNQWAIGHSANHQVQFTDAQLR